VAEHFAWYVGIDWGAQEHRVCLLDAEGRVDAERRVAHTAEAVHDMVRWLQAQTGARLAEIAVGLETPRGTLVDTLIEHGVPVFALNPKQLDRFRDRFTVGGAKDDRRDAQAVADGLRTDRRAFRRIQPDDPAIIQLRELCRLVEDLQCEEARLANRLREQLYRVDAAWLTFSPAAEDAWLWSLLAHAPHPAAWPQLPRARLAAALRAHRIRRVTVDELTAALHRPRLSVAAGVADAVALRVAALIPQIRLIHQQRTASERQIERWLERLATEGSEAEAQEHRDVEILRSLPGVGRMVAATMLADAAGPLAARDYATLRGYTGAAPITKRSGKCLHRVQMRYACKARLREALYHWARISLQHDQAARLYYDALRARGHGHARALRSVADRWLRILVAMLQTRSLYDPAKPRRLTPVAA
jgi:transposase